MKRLAIAAALIGLFGAPAFAAWGHHHHESDQPAATAEDHEHSGGQHNYTIFDHDPRYACWHLHGSGGPRGRSLWICEDH